MWQAKRVNFMITPDTIAAQLAAFDAAVAASPDDAQALEARANFLAATTWEFAPVLRDCRAALALRLTSGELADAQHSDLARAWVARLKTTDTSGERKFARAMAIAHFGHAMQNDEFDAELWTARARLWAAVGERERAESDFETARQISGESAHSWLDQALCFERLLQWDAAYDAYFRALRVGAKQGHWTLDAATCLAKAAREETPAYRRRAWLDAGVESEPDNADLYLARAQVLQRENLAGAEQDYERALALRPDDPDIYEARARSGVLWHHSTNVRDYETAVRLRVQSGEIAREVSALTTLAKAVKLREKPGHLSDILHAIAFYGVAIELAPHSHSLYLARAKLRAKVRPHRFENPDLLDTADEDWIRALALKPDLPDARRSLVEDLAESAYRATAHEQLEILLSLRELLCARGLTNELSQLILAEVQTQWENNETT